MPPRRFKKSGNKNKNTRKGSSLSDKSLVNHVSVVRIRSIPFYVEQAASGTGGITTANSQVSLAGNTTVPLDPFAFGGRFYLMASDFQQYMITKIRFRYQPMVSGSGVVATVAGATTTPSYAERGFAWGCLMDPAIGSLNFLTGIEAGLKVARTSAPSTLVYSGGTLRQWRYCSSTITLPSTTPIDLRLVSPLTLRLYFADTSTTAIQRYGFIMCDMVVAFRGCVANVVPIGIDRSLLKYQNHEEKIPDGLDPSGETPDTPIKVDADSFEHKTPIIVPSGKSVVVGTGLRSGAMSGHPIVEHSRLLERVLSLSLSGSKAKSSQ
jgi:hypothetical protein